MPINISYHGYGPEGWAHTELSIGTEGGPEPTDAEILDLAERIQGSDYMTSQHGVHTSHTINKITVTRMEEIELS
jgi:hypothetical protein